MVEIPINPQFLADIIKLNPILLSQFFRTSILLALQLISSLLMNLIKFVTQRFDKDKLLII